jgi:hypothetical protein
MMGGSGSVTITYVKVKVEIGIVHHILKDPLVLLCSDRVSQFNVKLTGVWK